MLLRRKIKKAILKLEAEQTELKRRAKMFKKIPSYEKRNIGQRMFEIKISLETLKKL